MSPPDRLYRTDFRRWARQQADAIRAGRVEDLWKPARHAPAMLLRADVELCGRAERHEANLSH
jgi:hypothetical protein